MARFIRKVINRYVSHLASLQITNEPNLSFMEGSKPYIMQVLVEGVITAQKVTRELNLPIEIGFGSVPESPAAVPHFWKNLVKAGNKAFIDSVDFVGHNFYVDVFEDQPLDLKEITSSVENTLRNLREKCLVTKSATERYLDLRKEYPAIDKRVSQAHIASYLGITPVSLSRIPALI